MGVALGQTAQSYNRIVNGAMQHSQENSASVTISGAYPADQWVLSYASSSTIYAVRSNPAAGSPSNHILLQASPVETAAAAAEYVQLVQTIEGSRVADIGLGLSSHKQIVIAFHTKLSVAGTYWVAIGTINGSHSWLGSYTISAGEVDTWVRKTVVIPAGAINAGTWSVDNTGSATLHFTYHCGTTYTGAAGFQAANVVAGPGQALGLSVTTGCALSNVGLYLDPNATGVPPPWVTPDYASELAACQRYFEQLANNDIMLCLRVDAAAQSYAPWYFKAVKRVVPAIAITGQTGPGGITSYTATQDSCGFFNTVTNYMSVTSANANARM
jgi:hypothetical protein